MSERWRWQRVAWGAQDIRRDAYWLQRRVAQEFGSAMDAAESQQLSEKVFKTLEVGARAPLCACAGRAAWTGSANPSHRGLAPACRRSHPAATSTSGLVVVRRSARW